MSYFIGIDLGTQSVKVGIYDERCKQLSIESSNYQIMTPKTGFAEQDPDDWWEKTIEALKRAISSLPKGAIKDIKAIGLSGQMHSPVMLDKNLKPIYPAVIWADQRSQNEAQFIRDSLGDKLGEICGSDIATGFMASTLLWFKNNRSDIFKKIHRVVLPKDYLKIKMGFPASTDYSDASATLLFNIRTREWSEEILKTLDFDPSIFPPLYHSSSIVGQLGSETKEILGVQGECWVVAGASDQSCAIIGNGVIQKGEILVNIGTGGQVISVIDNPVYDPLLRTHTFCHVFENSWYIMGAMLSAGLSLSWFKSSILDNNKVIYSFEDLDQEATNAKLGSEGLYFLPYLVGERTPHMNPFARGAFLNLHITHERADLVRSILEGVSYALKESVEIVTGLGIEPKKVIFAGGGSKSKLWRKILSSVLGLSVFVPSNREQNVAGAVLLAMLGVKHINCIEDGVKNIVSYEVPVFPEKNWEDLYREKYEGFKKAYSFIKPLFPK